MRTVESERRLENLITFIPSSTYEDALKRAATIWGLELSYIDVMGTEQRAAPETIRAVLGALGVRCGTLDELNATLEQRMEKEWGAACRVVHAKDPDRHPVGRRAPRRT